MAAFAACIPHLANEYFVGETPLGHELAKLVEALSDKEDPFLKDAMASMSAMERMAARMALDGFLKTLREEKERVDQAFEARKAQGL